MAGFFGLFSKKKEEEDPQPKDAFFLDDESAKSMGDTEYMKAPKSIRRTFPAGAAGEGHFETVVTVSALKSSVNDSRKDLTPKRVENQPPTSFTPAPSFSSASSFGNATPTYSAPAPQAPTVSNEEAQKRRQSDDSMDMFRNMAKKIKK